MTTPINGTAGTSIAASYTGPADGETIDAADVNAPFLAIANDMATIKSGNVTLTGAKTLSGQNVVNVANDSSFTINGSTGVNRTRVARGYWQFDSADFSISGYGVLSSLGSGTIASPPVAVMHIDFPYFAKLQDVIVWYRGGGGIVLPDNLPQIDVVQVNVTTGVQLSLLGGAVSDSVASIGDYNTVHGFTANVSAAPGVAIPSDTSRLCIRFLSEYGNNCAAGLTISGVQLVYSQTGLDT